MTKQELMQRAIDLAVENVRNGGGPFGAVIARGGEIVAEGVNRVTSQHDPTAHAEVQAIRKACSELNTFDLTGLDIMLRASLARCVSVLSIGHTSTTFTLLAQRTMLPASVLMTPLYIRNFPSPFTSGNSPLRR